MGFSHDAWWLQTGRCSRREVQGPTGRQLAPRRAAGLSSPSYSSVLVLAASPANPNPTTQQGWVFKGMCSKEGKCWKGDRAGFKSISILSKSSSSLPRASLPASRRHSLYPIPKQNKCESGPKITLGLIFNTCNYLRSCESDVDQLLEIKQGPELLNLQGGRNDMFHLQCNCPVSNSNGDWWWVIWGTRWGLSGTV